MNIMIISCFDTWEQRTDILYRCMTQAGHKVHVLSSDFRHSDKMKRTDTKLDFKFFHAMPYDKNLSFARILSHVRLSRDIFSYVEKNINSVELLWVLAPPNCFIKDASNIKKRHPSVRLIIDLMDLWPESFPFRLQWISLTDIWKNMRDNHLQSADGIVTECNLYRKVLGSKFIDIRLETIYLARENKGYHPEPAFPAQGVSLCFLGSVNYITDIAAIGRIIEQFRKNQPVVLHIIGDGENKDELIRTAEYAGAVVIDHGRVYDRDKKHKIFDSCHYGLNLMKKSVCVGLTMKSIDYFEFGLPVINNVRGDTKAAVKKYRLGVNWDDTVTFDPALHANAEYRKNARLFFEKYLTEDVFKDKVLHMIELSGNPPVSFIRKSNYGFMEIMRNAVTIMINKLQFPKARLIRYPVIIRGRQFIDFGKNLTTGYNCRFEVNGVHKDKVLCFGENVNAGDNVSIRCANKICIGSNVLIGSRVLIIDNSHGSYSGKKQDSPQMPPNDRTLQSAPVIIGDNVWIGEGAVIQMGVTVGKGTVIAANSIVTKSIESSSIAGGIPARVLKKWDDKSGVWKRIIKSAE